MVPSRNMLQRITTWVLSSQQKMSTMAGTKHFSSSPRLGLVGKLHQGSYRTSALPQSHKVFCKLGKHSELNQNMHFFAFARHQPSKRICIYAYQCLQQQNAPSSESEPPEFMPFYRLPAIVGLRILSRVKIAQTCLTLGLLPPLSYYHSVGVVTTWQLQFSIGLSVFALFMLYAMSFYLRRVIGAMYMHRMRHIVKVSHLNFWGSRRDLFVPVNDIIPLSEGSNKEGEVLKKFERYSTKQTLYYTLRFGRVINVEAFEDTFGSQ